jgi:hypothetical protein
VNEVIEMLIRSKRITHNDVRSAEAKLRRIAAIERELKQLGAGGANASKPKPVLKVVSHKLKLSPARKAQLKLHGEYMGSIRMLPAKAKAKVKAVRAKLGYHAAIKAAKAASKSKSKGK